MCMLENAKDFTKEWVEYLIALVSTAIAKDLIFYNAIAKLGVNGPLLIGG